MQLPNKNRINPNIEIKPFKKYVQQKGFIYCDETVILDGCFREINSDQIFCGDVFYAHLLAGQSIEQIYKVYLDWFNLTKLPHEIERVFVSVKQIKKREQPL